MASILNTPLQIDLITIVRVMKDMMTVSLTMMNVKFLLQGPLFFIVKVCLDKSMLIYVRPFGAHVT